MIREDRELLAELAQLNSDMTPLAMRIMDDSASAAEQQGYPQRLIKAGERLRRRVTATCGAVIDVVETSTGVPRPVRSFSFISWTPGHGRGPAYTTCPMPSSITCVNSGRADSGTK